MKNVIEVDAKMPLTKTVLLSFQHLLALVGGIVVPPVLLGIEPSIILLGSGLATLFFIFITKRQVPAFLCSSFAFMGPLMIAKEATGIEGMLFGIVAAGFVYVIVGLLVKIFGTNWISKLLPPVVVGSVVIIIGLSSGIDAISWSGFNPNDPTFSSLESGMKTSWLIVSGTTLIISILGTTIFKGVMSSLPILFAMLVGYIVSLVVGITPIDTITSAFNEGLVGIPNITTPKVSIEAALITMPIAFVAIGEHIADITAIGSVVGKDFIKKPGLHRTLLGDGIGTIISGFIGGTPNTTYSENIGVMAITKVYAVSVMKVAAIISIILSVIKPFNQIIMGVPTPVLGGVGIVLFGSIAVSGFKVLIENKVDFTKNRNMIICAVTIIIGLGGAILPISLGGINIEVSAIALATFTGVLLNLLLPEK